MRGKDVERRATQVCVAPGVPARPQTRLKLRARVEASMPVNNVSAGVWLAPARQSGTGGAASDPAVRG